MSKWDVDGIEFLRGVELFNRGQFYDAHEVLEDVWRPSGEPERKFLQALIQIAVGLHHHSTGNLIGAASLLKRAEHNLEEYPEQFHGIDLARLRASLGAWRACLAENKAVPPLPRL